MTTTTQRKPEPEPKSKRPLVLAAAASLALLPILGGPAAANDALEGLSFLALDPPIIHVPVVQNLDPLAQAALNGSAECAATSQETSAEANAVVRNIDGACMGPGQYCAPDGDL